MARDRFITPDNAAPAANYCRRVLIPLDVQYLSLFFGALVELTYEYNWEQYDGISPSDAAAAFQAVYDSARQTDVGCKMIGEIVAWAGTSSPDANWLVCDGSSLLRTDYPDLFAVIGTAYGAADSTHFNLPDLQGRAPMGAGSGSGLTSRAVGDTFGEENHTLTLAETATHSHTDAGHTHTEGIAAPAVGAAIAGVPIPSAIPAVGVTGIGFASLSTDGGGSAHNTIHPTLVIMYLIVAKEP